VRRGAGRKKQQRRGRRKREGKGKKSCVLKMNFLMGDSMMLPQMRRIAM
jgi:hypothetical protein